MSISNVTKRFLTFCNEDLHRYRKICFFSLKTIEKQKDFMVPDKSSSYLLHVSWIFSEKYAQLQLSSFFPAPFTTDGDPHCKMDYTLGKSKFCTYRSYNNFHLWFCDAEGFQKDLL